MIDQGLEASVNLLKLKLGDRFLPPSPSALHRLKGQIPRLSPSIICLYEMTGGIEPNSAFPLQLMGPDEVLSTVDCFRKLKSPPHSWPDAVLGDGEFGINLIKDNAGDLLGIYLAEPLAPRGFIWKHDDDSHNPSFFSLASMIRALSMPNLLFCEDVEPDYPIRVSSVPVAADKRLFTELMVQYRRDPANCSSYALAAMNLLDPAKPETLLEFVQSSNSAIASRACELIGFHRFLRAVPALTSVALKHQDDNNIVISAIVALRGWEHAEVRQALEVMRNELPYGFQSYIPK